ncbi:hypothetical protein AAF712_015241 [Marasmius tenuissimus]|uniref:Uncharacterized protein n=1 Tax=Marasmius tenuissimus TaxID=585030 RepID=A0ABR2ZA02_9AGAR
MKYVVRHQGEFSDGFQLKSGLLTGDSASPDLWDIYFCDLLKYIKDDPHTDPVLHNRAVGHLEQADDLAELALVEPALQEKLDGTQHWSDDNSAVTSAPKSRWMSLGKEIRAQWKTPYFHLDGRYLQRVDHYAYVGIDFHSTDRRLSFFTPHYEARAQKAASASAATFAVQDRIGPLPVKEARMLFMARVDPHLTFGCEVIIDINDGLLKKLEQVCF